MKKKTLLIVIVVLFLINFSSEAKVDFSGEIEYKLNNISVNSDNGQYIEDVFSKYNSEIYDSEFEQCLITRFNHQFSWGESKIRLGLLEGDSDDLTLDDFLFDLAWQDSVKFRIGTRVRPELSKYIFSNSEKKECNNEEATAGAIAEINYNNLKVLPLYLQVEEDIEDFTSDINVYGLDTNFLAKENLTIGTTALKTVPQEEEINDIQSQNNYSLTVDYQPRKWLGIDADLARSAQEDERYSEEVYGNLTVLNFSTELNSKLNTEFSYQDVHELYAPIRTTKYEEEYRFRENDYNQGYKITGNYRLPPRWKSTLKFKYSDFMRTNSYIQADPYVQNLGVAEQLEDNQIKTYELGLISERARVYSRLFYTHEVTTNDTDPSIVVDPTEEATENEDRDSNYSPGYKDKTLDTIHLYSKYKILIARDYNFNISGRYVWEQENNKYHNHNPNLSNQITENIYILGFDGAYKVNSRWDFNGQYNIEYHDIDFEVGNNQAAWTEGLLHDVDFNFNYQLSEQSSLNLSYNYRIYDLLDYDLSGEGEIYRYYDHDFNTHEINLSLTTKF
ncbi:hypothetical protein [Halanaerobacter jeridensis]|uniref:Beta-barrel porin 2 n=1 Tax=Halanaerobacter jeridensis TaxID=706427 RepID=A0A939BM52_9FIRM|nr:hypothetical protein [Halanaerobacter jeridensis]MBM7555635.1 hypothetical protein [Halanaerobacter jeridensis]